MSEKPIIQLIEEIVKFRQEYDETQDESHVLMMHDRASILAERLGCGNIAAMCLAFILTEVSWGRMPTRSDMMKLVPPRTTTVERLECIWELLDRKLVLSYKPARNPIRHFYIDQEVAEQLVANRVPSLKHQSLFPIEVYRKITINASAGKNDYEVLLDGKVVGFILMSATNQMYEVYWQGLLVHAAEELSSIVEWLNEAYSNGTLKSSQD